PSYCYFRALAEGSPVLDDKLREQLNQEQKRFVAEVRDNIASTKSAFRKRAYQRIEKQLVGAIAVNYPRYVIKLVGTKGDIEPVLRKWVKAINENDTKAMSQFMLPELRKPVPDTKNIAGEVAGRKSVTSLEYRSIGDPAPTEDPALNSPDWTRIKVTL